MKFVHPRTNGGPVRDVGTQFSSSVPRRDIEVDNEIETFTPTTILRREFKTNPNPNYAKYVSPENPSLVPRREAMTPPAAFQTPGSTYHRREPTPLRTAVHNIKQPNFRQNSSGVSTGTSMKTNTGDGGSLGIYSHKNSPLKKATSMYDMDRVRHGTPLNSLTAAAREIAEGRERDQRRSISPNKSLQDEVHRRTSVPPRYSLEAELKNPRGPSYY